MVSDLAGHDHNERLRIWYREVLVRQQRAEITMPPIAFFILHSQTCALKLRIGAPLMLPKPSLPKSSLTESRVSARPLLARQSVSTWLLLPNISREASGCAGWRGSIRRDATHVLSRHGRFAASKWEIQQPI
jgi:hypothetical protein